MIEHEHGIYNLFYVNLPPEQEYLQESKNLHSKFHHRFLELLDWAQFQRRKRELLESEWQLMSIPSKLEHIS